MKHGIFGGGVLVVACLVALPQTAIGRSFDAYATMPCEQGRDTRSVPGLTYCRVSVANGDFAGAAPPTGTETGRHKHPWDPGFTWIPTLPGPQHPILEHLVPWEFHGEGEPSYPKEVNGTPGVVLASPGDAVFQWVPVPVLDGKQSRETRYLVRVTYAPYNVSGNVGVGMRIIAADASTEHVSGEFSDTGAGSPGRPRTFEGWVDVLPGTVVTQLGLAVGKTADALPLVIQDVAVVEITSPYIDF
jgi:hypothetical protein